MKAGDQNCHSSLGRVWNKLGTPSGGIRCPLIQEISSPFCRVTVKYLKPGKTHAVQMWAGRTEPLPSQRPQGREGKGGGPGPKQDEVSLSWGLQWSDKTFLGISSWFQDAERTEHLTVYFYPFWSILFLKSCFNYRNCCIQKYRHCCLPNVFFFPWQWLVILDAYTCLHEDFISSALMAKT